MGAVWISGMHGAHFQRAVINFVCYSRSQVMFCAMVSGFDNVHYRANLSRMDIALKHGKTAGDGYVYVFAFSVPPSFRCRIYCGFAVLHANATRLYICDHRKTSIRRAGCLLTTSQSVSWLSPRRR